MSSALASVSPVSRELGDIRQLVAQHTHPDNGLTLDAERALILLRRLALIHKQVVNLEHEISVHRITRDGNAIAGILGDEALAVMGEGVIEAQGASVIRPDFRGGRK